MYKEFLWGFGYEPNHSQVKPPKTEWFAFLIWNSKNPRAVFLGFPLEDNPPPKKKKKDCFPLGGLDCLGCFPLNTIPNKKGGVPSPTDTPGENLSSEPSGGLCSSRRGSQTGPTRRNQVPLDAGCDTVDGRNPAPRSYHFDTMGNHYLLVFARKSFLGFLGGARFRPSTVFFHVSPR